MMKKKQKQELEKIQNNHMEAEEPQYEILREI